MIHRNEKGGLREAMVRFYTRRLMAFPQKPQEEAVSHKWPKNNHLRSRDALMGRPVV